MRKAIVIAALAASVCLLGGCDFLRSLAGRPTSRDLAAKRAAVEREDSLRAAAERELAQKRADSLALEDSLLRTAGKELIPSKQVGTVITELPFRYYVMIGAFKNYPYADNQAARAEKAGYPATLISFRNGFRAVGVCPTDRLSEAFASLKKLRGEAFCPGDAWIMVNE